jgi:Protein of unknown function (DUF2628)
MKYFDVFEHPTLGVIAIKHGFSWPGFLFHGWWALFHRLWLEALLLFGVPFTACAVIALILSPPSASGDAAALLFCALLWLLIFLVYVVAGFKGNDWRRANVSKRGFTYVGTEQADTPDAAVAAAIRKRRNDTKNG